MFIQKYSKLVDSFLYSVTQIESFVTVQMSEILRRRNEVMLSWLVKFIGSNEEEIGKMSDEKKNAARQLLKRFRRPGQGSYAEVERVLSRLL